MLTFWPRWTKSVALNVSLCASSTRDTVLVIPFSGFSGSADPKNPGISTKCAQKLNGQMPNFRFDDSSFYQSWWTYAHGFADTYSSAFLLDISICLRRTKSFVLFVFTVLTLVLCSSSLSLCLSLFLWLCRSEITLEYCRKETYSSLWTCPGTCMGIFLEILEILLRHGVSAGGCQIHAKNTTKICLFLDRAFVLCVRVQKSSSFTSLKRQLN